MYTEAQYRKAKAALDDPQLESKVGPERMGKWAQRIEEYEAAQAAAPAAQAGPAGGLSPEDEVRLTESPAVPLPNDATPPEFAPPSDTDFELPNASKLKKYSSPPEYVSKSRSGLSQIAEMYVRKGGIDGLSATMHFEPSERQFEADMGPYLQAKGIAPGTEDYQKALDTYRDAKWEQAYKAAEAEDRTLTRAEYVPEHAPGWDKLTAWLGDKADTASAFTKGIIHGRTLGLTRALERDSDRVQRERSPVASGIGELAGAVNPKSLVSKLTSGVGKLGAVGRLGRYGASAVAGGVAGTADVAGHAIGDTLSDKLHGRPPDPEERSNLTGRLLGGALFGAGGGALGEGVGALAQRYSRGIRDRSTKFGEELSNAESTGTATNAMTGLEPSSDVRAMLERARGPVPGENKPLAMGSPVEQAASDVRGPIVAQQVDERAAALKRMEEDAGAMYARDPALKKGHGMHETGQTLLKTVLDRSQPEAADKFLPSADDALGATNNAQFSDMVRKLFKPRLVDDVDAAAEAARTGGHVVTLEEAQRAGFKVKGLETELNPETGVPHNAPSLSSYSNVSEGELLPDSGSMPWFPQGNPVDVLPKYGKDTLAAHADEVAGFPGATPEQAAALNKWSFGHDEAIRGVQKGTPDAELIAQRLKAYGGPVDKLGVPHEQHLAEARAAATHIAEYLKNTPPASKLPFVYRGLVMSREDAKKFLQQSSFDLGNAASSVSADPAVARSFVARNLKDGDVGITLKLGHNNARDISPYAADRVKVERELMLPPGSKFGAVNRYEDASNPGHYIVEGKHAPSPDDLGATRPEIELPPPGAPAAQHDVELPPGRQEKTFRVILEPREYDALKMEQQIQAIDRAGKAGTDAKVDPAWPELMRAARIDREQFGKAWSGLKNVHHEELTALEQRAAHAGIAENKHYPDMSGNAQKTANAAITNYGVAPQATNEALAELAGNAGVRGGLETLRGTRAYSALKESASPNMNEGITGGGGFLRLGGFGPALKLRADVFARGLARGPDGLPMSGTTVTPAQVGQPLERSLLPSSGLLAMGRGALGVKTGSVYDSATGRSKPGNSLTPQERAQLEKLLTP